MLPSMWKENDIFLLATTLHIIVTDELKEELEQFGITNAEFRLYD